MGTARADSAATWQATTPTSKKKVKLCADALMRRLVGGRRFAAISAHVPFVHLCDELGSTNYSL